MMNIQPNKSNAFFTKVGEKGQMSHATISFGQLCFVRLEIYHNLIQLFRLFSYRHRIIGWLKLMRPRCFHKVDNAWKSLLLILFSHTHARTHSMFVATAKIYILYSDCNYFILCVFCWLEKDNNRVSISAIHVQSALVSILNIQSD